MMKSIRFEVDGKVVGKARPRITRAGRAYTPASTRMYEGKIRDAFIAAGGDKLSGTLHVDFEAVTGIQSSATRRETARRLSGQELSTARPDIDNIEKVVLDALNGVAYKDDASVVSIRAIKGRYEETPRLIVRVREIDPEEIAEIHGWMWGI